MKQYLIGFSPWKRFFKNYLVNCVFLKNSITLDYFIKIVKPDDFVYIWNYKIHSKILKYIRKKNIHHKFVEDGFIRSFGLGSDFTKPYSVIFDSSCNYFDSRYRSNLEEILNNLTLNKFKFARSRKLIKLINSHQISKYNLDRKKLNNKLKLYLNTLRIKKKIIFIPGQVTSDASIKYGTFKFKSELDILNIKNKDDFFIIYKPHPDVIANNRDGINLEIIKKKINLLADNYSTNECIDCADEVHTLTSLSGFEALIRGKKVFTYGAPFYAGWGLTEDIDKSSPAFNRRIKKLNLEGLVYGTLIKYPIYWDYQKKKISTCEKTIKKIIKERNEYWKINKKSLIEMPFFLRQIKKVSNFLNSFFY